MHSIVYVHSFITAMRKWDMAQQINQYDTWKTVRPNILIDLNASKECLGSKMQGYSLLDILANNEDFFCKNEIWTLYSCYKFSILTGTLDNQEQHPLNDVIDKGISQGFSNIFRLRSIFYVSRFTPPPTHFTQLNTLNTTWYSRRQRFSIFQFISRSDLAIQHECNVYVTQLKVILLSDPSAWLRPDTHAHL